MTAPLVEGFYWVRVHLGVGSALAIHYWSRGWLRTAPWITPAERFSAGWVLEVLEGPLRMQKEKARDAPPSRPADELDALLAQVEERLRAAYPHATAWVDLPRDVRLGFVRGKLLLQQGTRLFDRGSIAVTDIPVVAEYLHALSFECSVSEESERPRLQAAVRRMEEFLEGRSDGKEASEA